MKKLLVLLITILVGVLAAQAAAAAVVPDRLNLEFWPEYDNGQVLFIGAVEYPANIPLPIEVKVAVPKGANVTWSGEITGGPPSQDINVTPKVNPQADYDEVVFTLSKTRKGQVEAIWSGLKINGQDRSINWDWVQRYEAKQVQFGFKAPSKSSSVTMTPASAQVLKGQDKLDYYASAPLSLPVGGKQTFSVAYKRSAVGPSITPQQQQQQFQGGAPGGTAAGSSGKSSSDILIYMFLLLTVGAVVFAVYNNKKKNARE